MNTPQIGNGSDMVAFGRSLCSRQHAFEAMLHYGMSDAEAREKAFALVGSADFAFNEDQPRDEHGRWTGGGGGAAAAKHFGIDNANPIGHQGQTELHKKNPYHELLSGKGFQYSHSTPIGHPDGSWSVHHTYKSDKHGERSIGVEEGKWTSSPSSSSGRMLQGKNAAALDKHLSGLKGKPAEKITTNNPAWGAHGEFRSKHGDKAPELFHKAAAAITDHYQVSAQTARNYLDSVHGRHVASLMNDGHAAHSAMLEHHGSEKGVKKALEKIKATSELFD